MSVREVPQTESPANPGPGLLTTAAASAVTESTPPAEPTSNTNAQSPSTHHSHFQGEINLYKQMIIHWKIRK